MVASIFYRLSHVPSIVASCCLIILCWNYQRTTRDMQKLKSGFCLVFGIRDQAVRQTILVNDSFSFSISHIGLAKNKKSNKHILSFCNINIYKYLRYTLGRPQVFILLSYQIL